MPVFSDTIYCAIVNELEKQFQDTSALWCVAANPSQFFETEIEIKTYADQIELFCKTLEWAILQNRFCLAKKGIFLEELPRQQADRFREAFPKTKGEMSEKDAYWWFLDECPGGIVWYTDVDDGFQTSSVGDGRFYFWT